MSDSRSDLVGVIVIWVAFGVVTVKFLVLPLVESSGEDFEGLGTSLGIVAVAGVLLWLASTAERRKRRRREEENDE